MTASEIKTLVQLENKYKTVVVWHRIYGCTENGDWKIMDGIVG